MTSDASHRLPGIRGPAPNILVLSAILALLVAVLSVAVGPTGLSLSALPRAVSASMGWTDDAESRRMGLILIGVRLPRTVLGLFVGGALAMAGVMMQGLFRNPLADPGLIGVSSGAALAAIATIALGNGMALGFTQALGLYAVPVAAFLGGLCTTFALVSVANRNGQVATGTLLLAGVAIAALTGALSGLIAFVSDDRELRDLTLWSMGSLSGASWAKVTAVLPFAVVLAFLVPRLTRGLNGFLLGESEAFHLGIDTETSKRAIVAATAAAVGAAVAVAGIVGFVGLVVPHFIRLLASPDHRVVLPASACAGGAIVVGADVIARMAAPPAELPLGIVMAAIGAPLFLHLVLRRGAGGMDQ